MSASNTTSVAASTEPLGRDELKPIISLPSWVLILNLIIALLVFLGVGLLYEDGSDLRVRRLQVAGLLLLTLGVASLLVRRIGTLWRAARTTSRQLAELNESLEDRVAERTRELAAVNADLGRSKLITEEQSRSRRELLHVLCHDLANPLTSIQEVVRQLQIDKGRWELLFPILSLSSQNAVDVIELVREIQVIEDRPMDLLPVNLSTAAESAATMLRGQLARKRVSLDIEIDGSLQVIAEPTSLVSSVLSNILTNAIKFSPAGEKVQLQATTRGGRVYIRCSDHGIGMSESIRRSLFDIGKNISRVGTEGETGTGFGMPMVKKFVTAYGGTLEVQSVDDVEGPARGTVVLVILPLFEPSGA
ncbi:MAG: HAMP domain-containing histidine kinase [Lentisphaerae bacterium]|nr:HAMP domain-containing histidine kinase [Lentisphaerota bacterium]